MVEEKQEFALEKILTMSAGDYARHKDCCLDEYDIIGVHILFSGGEGVGKHRISVFAKNIPENTEVVTDYHEFHSSDGNYRYNSAHGVALIPRPKDSLLERKEE